MKEPPPPPRRCAKCIKAAQAPGGSNISLPEERREQKGKDPLSPTLSTTKGNFLTSKIQNSITETRFAINFARRLS
jgi:hypothetical protein